MAEQERPDGVNVQVLLRCRPLSDREIVDRTPQAIVCSDVQREVTLIQNAGGKQMSKVFRFDKVFGPDSTQERLYKQAIIPIVNEVMDGFNCTIFAYGQTGTGKTYTMEGGPRQSNDGRKLSAEAGVIPRAIRQIFDTLESGDLDSAVKVSFLELYNEELTDLLSSETDTPSQGPSGPGNKNTDSGKPLRLLEDRSGVVVQNLEEVSVTSAVEIYQVLDRGTVKRRTAATLLNNRSSRSHSIFSITIHLKETTPEGEDVIKVGKLNLVDLAGSENISRSGAKDSRAREAGSINQSLLTLGRVITALVEHSGHIPYRDSKLTRLLRDSLGGRTKTCIIATIAPTVQCQEETISTLDYAHRAKNIKNKPEVNQKISKTALIKDMASEIEKLKLDLMCTRDKNGVFLPLDRYEQGEMERTQLRESVKVLKAELEEITTEHEKEVNEQNSNHEKEVEGLQNDLDIKRKELTETQDSLNESVIMAQERQFVILSHQRAEAALAAHAQNLTGELSSCASDMGALFNKLEELATLQGADREVMVQVKGLVSERLRQLDASLAGAVGNQQEALSAVGADLGSYRVKRETDAVQLRDQVKAMQSSLAELKDSLAVQLSTQKDFMVGALSRTGDMTKEYSIAAVVAADAAHAKASESVSSFISLLEQQGVEIRTLADKQANLSSDTVAAVSEMASGAKASFSSLSEALSKLQVSTTQRAAKADSDLASFASQFDASMQQEQDALIQQMGAAIKAFTQQRSAAMESVVAGLRQNMAQETSLGSSTVFQVETEARAAIAAIEESESSLRAKVDAGAKSCVDHAQSISVAMQQAVQVGSKEKLPALAAAHQSQTGMIQKLKEGMGGLVEQGGASAVEMSQKGVAGVETAVLEVQSKAQEMSSVVETQKMDGLAVVDNMLSMASEASVSLGAFGAAQKQQHSVLGGDVGRQTDTQLSHKVNMGTAPGRRAVPLPPASAVADLICPTEEIVLQQYRKEKAQTLMRGGDARYLLSPNNGGFVRDEATRVRETQAAVISQEHQKPADDDTPHQDQEQENRSSIDCLPSTKGSSSNAKGASNVKSRIPSFPSLTSPDGVEPLMDTTNSMEIE